MIAPPGASVPRDTPIIQGAQAAIEGGGATAVICEGAQFTRRQARCGRKVVDGLVVVMFFPGPFEVPGRLVDRGLAVAIVGAPGSAPTEGTVLVREDPAAYGLEQGRAAGVWAAAAWPDTDVIVNVRPASVDPQDAYYQAVAAGFLETLPTATILPPVFGAPADVEANLYTGAMQAGMVAVPLAGGALGPPGGPVAIFPLGCPDPLPTGETFAGCIELGYEVVGEAAVDAVASIVAGAETPERDRGQSDYRGRDGAISATPALSVNSEARSASAPYVGYVGGSIVGRPRTYHHRCGPSPTSAAAGHVVATRGS